MSIALRNALFDEGLDIADDDIIAKVAASFGIDAIDPDATEAAVRDDWERGKARGVQGSPHFFAGDRDWFCPSLYVRHDDSGFDVGVARVRTNEFYAAVLD